MGAASATETCALNSSTLPSVLTSCCNALAADSGLPSVAMPSVMLMTSGG